MDGELYLICDSEAVEFGGHSSFFVPQIQGTVCSQHLLLCHQNIGLSHSVSSFYASLPCDTFEAFYPSGSSENLGEEHTIFVVFLFLSQISYTKH